MPRRAPYLLRWSSSTQIYEIFSQDIPHKIAPDSPAWFAWLDKIPSFAFQSRSGIHYTARRETIQSSGTYWYAYRSVQGKTMKRYLGRTASLSTARLEEVVHLLTNIPPLQKPAETTVEQSTTFLQHTSNVAKPYMERLTPLLSSKLAPPRLSSSLVERSRLHTHFKMALLHKVTLLKAPSGSGKTTAVNQWSSVSSLPIAWVSLDASDNDPVRFWRYIVTACQTFPGETIGQSVLDLLSAVMQPPFQLPPLETALTLLLNDIAQQIPEGLLVLDDYHVVQEPRIHETMTFFVDHLPTTLRVLIISRSEPALPLLRWRSRGDIYELPATELRFSLDETATFLQQILPIFPSDALLQQFNNSLEGWAAGLRLLALTLQGRGMPGEIEGSLFAAENRSDHSPLYRPILNYFVTEILDAQPEAIQCFLLQTSVLSRLSGPLCDAVTAGENSTTLLESVERSGLFLESLDGAWYHYHALFAEAIRSEARRRLGEEEIRTLSLRASHWYEQNARPVEAIEAALLAHALPHAALLIERAETERIQFEPQTMRRWLEMLPPDILHAHPTLCLLLATTLRFPQSGEAEAPPSKEVQERIDNLLGVAEERWQEVNDHSRLGVLYAFQALSVWQMNLFSAVAYAEKSLTLLSSESADRPLLIWRGVCQTIIGTGKMHQGLFPEAYQRFLEAHPYSQLGNDKNFVHGVTLLLGWCSLVLGKLHQTADYYQQILPATRMQENKDHAIDALLGLAHISYEWNDLTTAEQLIYEAIELQGYTGRESSSKAALHLAVLRHVQGETLTALQQIATLLAHLQTVSPPHMWLFLPEVLSWQARLQLAAGDIQGAEHSIGRLVQSSQHISFGQNLITKILQARLLLAQDKTQEAESLLESLLPVAHERQILYNILEIHLLLALTCAARKKSQQARYWLRQALSQAYSEGFLRLFIDEGEPLAHLLRSLLPTLKGKALYSYVQTILHAFPTTRKVTSFATSSQIIPIESLSPQEQRVLRLLAAGCTNAEIASELVVSINTIKAHVKHLYRKLNVANRHQASEIARRFPP